MYCKISQRLAEQHLPGILDELLDLHEEGDGLSAIKQTVVVSQSEVHHLHLLVTRCM